MEISKFRVGFKLKSIAKQWRKSNCLHYMLFFFSCFSFFLSGTQDEIERFLMINKMMIELQHDEIVSELKVLTVCRVQIHYYNDIYIVYMYTQLIMQKYQLT